GTGPGAVRAGPRRSGQPRAELHHGVPDAASLRRGQTGPARVDPRRGRRGRLGTLAARAPRRAGDVRYLFLARGFGRLRPGRYPDRLPEARLCEGDSPRHGRGRGRCLRRDRRYPHLAFPQGAPSWREGRGLWHYFLAPWGTIGFRSSG